MICEKNIGKKGGVLVIDEKGFLKLGKHSCGLKCQYSGTAGRIETAKLASL
jgi:SRSO17 transposase